VLFFVAMTGGRQRLDDDWGRAVPREPERLSTEEMEHDAAMERWMLAARFRREANRLLKPCGISFGAWRVLDGVDRLVRRHGDCVSQLEVAAYCDIDANTASSHVWKLARNGELSLGLDAWGQCYRIFVAEKGTALLAEARSAVIGAARETGLVSGAAWRDVG
jgi:hypothetical protein